MPRRIGSGSRFPRSCWLLVLAMAGTSLAARLPAVAAPLWVDELHTAWVLAGPWNQIFSRAAIGNQSPVYFALSRPLVELLGMSEFSLRLASMASGGLLVGALAAFARWLTRSWAAALAVGLIATLDLRLAWYATEARCYALVQLLAVFYFWAFARLTAPLPTPASAPAGPAPRAAEPTSARHGQAESSCWTMRAAHIASGALACALHPVAGLLVGAQLTGGLGLLVWRRATGGAAGYLQRQWWADLAAIGAAGALPILPLLQEVAGRREAWEQFIAVPSGWALLTTIRYVPLLAAPAVVLLAERLLAKVRPVPSGEARGGFPAGRGHARAAATQPGPGQGEAVWLVGCWVAVPLLASWLVSQPHWGARLFHVRYLSPSIPGAIVLGAALAAACRTTAGRRASLVLWLAGACWLGGGVPRLLSGRPLAIRNEDWPGAVAWIDAGWRPGDLLLVRSDLIESNRLRGPASRTAQDTAGRDTAEQTTAGKDTAGKDTAGKDTAEQLSDYCLLPLGSLYAPDRVPAEAMVPLPSARSGDLLPATARRAERAPRIWLLLRGGRGDRDALVQQLARRWDAGVRRQEFGRLTAACLTRHGGAHANLERSAERPATPAPAPPQN